MATFEHEVWRDVLGFEGWYEVSSRGGVRSIERWVVHVDGVRRRFRGKPLKMKSSGSGHLRVSLSKNGKVYDRWVHRLVAEAFVGAIPVGKEVCHENGDPADNRAENLRVDTRSSNMHDRRKHGVDFQTNKRECPRGHPLAAPNLVASASRGGTRECLACSRARARVRHHPDLRPQLDEIADGYLAAIMSS